MSVEITLFGFGDDRPHGFKDNTRQINPGKVKQLDKVLELAGFDNLEGLVLLLNNKGVPQQDWSETRIQDNDSIKILSAIEGG